MNASTLLRSASLFAAVVGLAAPWPSPIQASPAGRAQIRVGIDEGDLRGNDNRVLQAAVDYVARLGGGSVSIGPGRYTMRNALTLRSQVRISGVAGKTILVACEGVESPLAADGDCNERQITLQNPAGFRVGDGVSIQDGRKGGFEVTTATLTEQIDANTFRLSAPLYLDYMCSDKASARLVFPVVGGWNVTNVVVDGLSIEGNRAQSLPLNGCRGGGIYLFECADVTIRNCVVREYNGDGISFQVSPRIVVEDCRSENNAGLGLHPGSGSQHPIVRRNVSVGNDSDGLFVCWRVKHGVFEGNELRANKGMGISIGHKDSDNVFRKNKVTSNAKAGVFFRPETEAMGAHRNLFEENIILDNGLSADGAIDTVPIVIRGVHRDVQFRNNTIGYSKPVKGSRSAVSASSASTGLRLEKNELPNIDKEFASEK
ncbi:MAG: right-handed parallel beta-helix repeat-containing protein [Verrucomicrobiota bacterium]